MALKRDVHYPGRFVAASTAHPQGAFKNRTTPTAQDGSYLEADWMNDIDGFFARALNIAGVTPNGNADTGTSSQLFDSVVTAMPGKFLGATVLTQTGTYSPRPGAKTLIVEAISGGGGSRTGSTASGQTGGTTPGYHGQYNKSLYQVSNLSFPITVTVGLGGAANSYGGATFFGPYMSLDGGNPADGTLSSSGAGIAGNAYARIGATNTSTGFILSSSQGISISTPVIQVTAGTAAGFFAPMSPFPGGWQGRGADGIYAPAGTSYTGKTGNPGYVLVLEFS